MRLIAFFILFPIYLLSGFVLAQKTPNLNKKKISSDTLSVEFETIGLNKREKKLKSDRFYFWYKAQAIHSTQGGSSGELLNGVYTSFWRNNQLYEKGNFETGLKNGDWKLWNLKGELVRTDFFKDGILKKTTFHNSKHLTYIEFSRKRTLKSYQNVDSLFKPNGKIKIVSRIDGRKRIISLKQQQLHGFQLFYNDSLKFAYFFKGRCLLKKRTRIRGIQK